MVYGLNARSTVVPKFVGGGATTAGSVKTKAVVLVEFIYGGCEFKYSFPILIYLYIYFETL